MDIEQLKFFISAAVLNNFSAAAAENNISQSAFSKQIRSLEDEVKVDLFERRGRTVQLSAAGKCFLEYACAMVSQYNRMKSDMARFNRSSKVIINLSTIGVMPQYGITEAIMNFCSVHRQVSFSIYETESENIKRSLRKLESDFGIIRTECLEEDSYNMIPLAEDQLIAVVSDEHRFAGKKSIHFQELEGERLIFPTSQSDVYTICMNACQKVGFSPNISFRISGRADVAFALVRQENAILLAFDKVMSYYQMEGCRIVKIDDNISSTTALVWLKAAEQSNACKAFRDYMAARAYLKKH